MLLAVLLCAEKAVESSKYVVHMQDGTPLTKSAFAAMWRLIERRTVKDGQQLGSSPRNRGDVKRAINFDVTPHLLRHTYITRLFDAGVDLKTVQYLAGHATPEITLRIYVHYLKSQKQVAAAQKIEAVFSSKV